jgi:hypothetical protein
MMMEIVLKRLGFMRTLLIIVFKPFPKSLHKILAEDDNYDDDYHYSNSEKKGERDGHGEI